VLEYFGAYIEQDGESSDFEQFTHVEKVPDTKWPYSRQRWLEIVLLFSQNFRNAIAPMHYKLFEFENVKHHQTFDLQKDAKALYQRQDFNAE
jgi:hypothetical protein